MYLYYSVQPYVNVLIKYCFNKKVENVFSNNYGFNIYLIFIISVLQRTINFLSSIESFLRPQQRYTNI